LMRLAGLMAQREIYEDGAWRIHCARDIHRRGHAERRNSGGLDYPCDQSNGLMTNGSSRHQEKSVRMCALEFICDSRRQLIADFSR
jgi:hypothetical protein